MTQGFESFLSTTQFIDNIFLIITQEFFHKKRTDKNISSFWLGWQDSNLRNATVKVWCLTGLATSQCAGVDDGTRTHDNQNHNLALYQLNYIHHMNINNFTL